MDRGAWWATVFRVTKSQTQLKQLSTNSHMMSTALKYLPGVMDTLTQTKLSLWYLQLSS